MTTKAQSVEESWEEIQRKVSSPIARQRNQALKAMVRRLELEGVTERGALASAAIGMANGGVRGMRVMLALHKNYRRDHEP